MASTAAARARLEASGIQTLMFPRARWLPSSVVARWGISYQLTLWLLRNVRNYDIVHVDYVWPWSTLVAAIAGTRAGRPVVMTAHESLTSFDIEENSTPAKHKILAKRQMRRLLMKYVDLILMTSDLECADSIKDTEQATVIPHAVATDLPIKPIEEPSLPPLIVGYIGRLHPKKNVGILLRAVAMLEIPAKLVICGDGDPHYRQWLHQLADELSLTECIEWCGQVDDVGRANLFARSHVIVMASMYECFGMSAAEAMAAGVPVVVSKTTGVASVVQMYECGKIVDPGEIDQLRDALAEFYRDSAWRGRARINALQAAVDTYSYSSYRKRISEIYTRLIAEV